MRAARLLHILLLLQNRGRLTAGALAAELEVAHRTILRDMDALSEAGLPIIAHQGNQGGFELGFSYRTRLTGLAADEAEALAVLLDDPSPLLVELGMADAARRAISKIQESLPDQVRARLLAARRRFRVARTPGTILDPRVTALAAAVRDRRRVRLEAKAPVPRQVHPTALVHTADGWAVVDELTGSTIPQAAWKDINISALSF